jgi:hypothetical protein
MKKPKILDDFAPSYHETEEVARLLRIGKYCVDINPITAEFLGDVNAKQVTFNSGRFITDTGIPVDSKVWHTLDPITFAGAAGGEIPLPMDRLESEIRKFTNAPFEVKDYILKFKQHVPDHEYAKIRNDDALDYYVIKNPAGKGAKIASLGLLGALGLAFGGGYLYLTSDKDGDGIPDYKDPHPDSHEDHFKDSDNDGLNDWDENHVYHTNPNDIDTDKDFVSDGYEVRMGTDPTKIISYGKIDDFNRLLVYKNYLNPNNSDRDQAFLKMIPNVKASPIKFNEEGVKPFRGYLNTGEIINILIKISERDPLIKDYYLKKMEIKWEPDGNHAKVFVDGKPIWSDYQSIDGINPSFYFTNGRYGTCYESPLTDFVMLKLVGENPKLISGVDSDGKYNSAFKGDRHEWIEFAKDGKDFVMDYNNILPKEEFYKINWKNLEMIY